MKKFFILFLFFYANTLHSQNWDINILKEINIERNTSFDNSFKVITESATPISIGLPLLGYGIGLIKRDSVLKSHSFMIGVSVITAVGLTTVLKYTIQRERPFKTYPEIHKITLGGSPSFPSGHTTEAFALATSLSLACPKWYVVAPAYTWATAVGYSRMHLGVHYPSDVFVGALIGAGSAYLSFKVKKWYDRKYQHNFFY